MADLIYEVHNHLARITLNRPKQLNCFSEEMIRLWTEALEDVRDNDDVYALLLSRKRKSVLRRQVTSMQGQPVTDSSKVMMISPPQPSQERIHSGRESKEFRFF